MALTLIYPSLAFLMICCRTSSGLVLYLLLHSFRVYFSCFPLFFLLSVPTCSSVFLFTVLFSLPPSSPSFLRLPQFTIFLFLFLGFLFSAYFLLCSCSLVLQDPSSSSFIFPFWDFYFICIFYFHFYFSCIFQFLFSFLYVYLLFYFYFFFHFIIYFILQFMLFLFAFLFSFFFFLFIHHSLFLSSSFFSIVFGSLLVFSSFFFLSLLYYFFLLPLALHLCFFCLYMYFFIFTT